MLLETEVVTAGAQRRGSRSVSWDSGMDGEKGTPSSRPLMPPSAPHRLPGYALSSRQWFSLCLAWTGRVWVTCSYGVGREAGEARRSSGHLDQSLLLTDDNQSHPWLWSLPLFATPQSLFPSEVCI